VRANRIRKSVGAENTFAADLTEFGPMADRVAASDRQGLAALRRHWQSRPDRHAEGEVQRLRDHHAQQICTYCGSGRSDLESLAFALLQNEMPVPKPVRLWASRSPRYRATTEQSRNSVCLSDPLARRTPGPSGPGPGAPDSSISVQRVSRYQAAQDVFVRSARHIDDPTSFLAAKINETPRFADDRSKFVRCVVNQRAASMGMSALTSSAVELEAHQIEVVRRVLQDPIQRYLLADEVGLGKTIEASVLIRQCIIDGGGGVQSILVVVPDALVAQWRSDSLEGEICLINGDDIPFIARRSKTSSTAC
jgi:hypothetical protein